MINAMSFMSYADQASAHELIRLDPNRLQDFILRIVIKRGARNPMAAEDPNRRYLEITGDDLDSL